MFQEMECDRGPKGQESRIHFRVLGWAGTFVQPGTEVERARRSWDQSRIVIRQFSLTKRKRHVYVFYARLQTPDLLAAASEESVAWLWTPDRRVSLRIRGAM